MPGTQATFFFLQQTQREFPAREPGAADVRENVERTERLEAWEAHIVQTADDEVPARFIFLAHHRHVALAAFERLDGGVLRHRISAEDRILVHLHHRLGERRRCAGVADAESRHRERL